MTLRPILSDSLPLSVFEVLFRHFVSFYSMFFLIPFSKQKKAGSLAVLALYVP